MLWREFCAIDAVYALTSLRRSDDHRAQSRSDDHRARLGPDRAPLVVVFLLLLPMGLLRLRMLPMGLLLLLLSMSSARGPK